MLTEDTTPVEPPKTPEEGYHLTEDLADQAISYLRTHKSPYPDKPLFVYFVLAPPMRRITCRRNGSASTAASSPPAGTGSGRSSSPGKKELGIIPTDADLPGGPGGCRFRGFPGWMPVNSVAAARVNGQCPQRVSARTTER